MMNIEDLQRVKSDYENGVLVNRITQLQVLEAALSAVAPLVQCVPQQLNPMGSIRDSCDFEDFVDDLRRFGDPKLSQKIKKEILREIVRTIDSRVEAGRLSVQQPSRNEVLEEAALACEAWGNEKVLKWQDDPEMCEDAKARAWDALQCATAIRTMKIIGGAK